ncbi:hypothetical protein OESDEN_12743 [Oesophagostomum dentatum]|uniref:Microspherule protein N-terminal domain-containing protein n=1 Tax=Oesophagostomum dentatum TaxID=61180 RepID=A0A0B1SRA4_OESDE|nr:hypothetical protein OESDEN_12743 [Oesophagostomum dentatum]
MTSKSHCSSLDTPSNGNEDKSVFAQPQPLGKGEENSKADTANSTPSATSQKHAHSLRRRPTHSIEDRQAAEEEEEAAKLEKKRRDARIANKDIRCKVHDLRAAYGSIKFSRPYSMEDIEERWYQLMYDDTLSRQAKKRMNELPIEEILRIQLRIMLTIHICDKTER